MQTVPALDALRDDFRSTFERYIHEGRRMAELLIELEESTEAIRFRAINEQQDRVNDAQARYEEARQAYVEFVLGGFVGSGGSGLPIQH